MGVFNTSHWDSGYGDPGLVSETVRNALIKSALPVLFLMCIISLHTLVLHDVSDLSGSALINASVFAFALIINLIVYASVLLDGTFHRSKNLFLLMAFLTGVILFAGHYTWTVDHHPEFWVLNYLSNSTVMGVMFVFLVVFWLYVCNELNIDRGIIRKSQIVILVLAALAVVNILINPATHFVFSVDDGTYERGDLFVAANLPTVFIGAIIVFTSMKYTPATHNRNVELSFLMIPVGAIILQLFMPDYSLFPLSWFVTLMLAYANFYVYRGRMNAEVDKKLTEQRFANMYSQIQPHFLYNSLTSIMNLPGTSPETREAIAEFGKYLRGNLESLSRKHPIQVRMEMSHVETYIGLEKMRFKEKLNVEIDMQDVAFFVPALSVQMMVENAIRHGVTMREEGGTVRITSRFIDNVHTIVIEDNGVGFDVDAEPDDDFPHCGIPNTRRCLEESGGTLTITSRPGIGTKVIIRIPAKQKSAAHLLH